MFQALLCRSCSCSMHLLRCALLHADHQHCAVQDGKHGLSMWRRLCRAACCYILQLQQVCLSERLHFRYGNLETLARRTCALRNAPPWGCRRQNGGKFPLVDRLHRAADVAVGGAAPADLLPAADFQLQGLEASAGQLAAQLSNMFPLWVALTSGLGLTHPAALAWFRAEYTTAALALTMLAMGTSLTFHVAPLSCP